MAQLDTASIPRPNGFEVLKKWCGWITSPKEEGGFVVNATTFSMLVDFKRDGASICQKTVTVSPGTTGFTQEEWNTKMANAESLTTDEIAAIPAVMALIQEAAKGV